MAANGQARPPSILKGGKTRSKKEKGNKNVEGEDQVGKTEKHYI